MEKDCLDFICEIERDCEKLSRDIISRICKRAIRRMNKQEKDSHMRFASVTDEFPDKFSFFDILSIEIQEYDYDEINPFLREYIEKMLEEEYYNVSTIERFVLDHSECVKFLDCDYAAVEQKLFNAFHNMLNEHWSNTKKIKEYLLK